MKPDCPCGSLKAYPACCGRLHAGAAVAATAEELMRSRYSAFAFGLAPYLLATWHASTRPAHLDLTQEGGTKWLELRVQRRQPGNANADANRATVEFIARYRVGGRGHRLHEISRFVREGGRWFYVDGDIKAS